jgi:hypothetical protein
MKRLAIVLVLTLPLYAAPWPDTKVGTLAKRWVQAFNRGEDAMRKFLSESMAEESLRQRSAEERIATYKKTLERFHTLEFTSVVRSTPAELEVRLTDSAKVAHDFIFEVQKESPFKLLSVKARETHMQGDPGDHQAPPVTPPR